MMKAALALAFSAMIVGMPASAQQIIQSSRVTPGHALRAITQNVAGDAGAGKGGGPGIGLTEPNITSGSALPATALGQHFCVNDAPTTGPFHQLCFDPHAQGG